MTLLSMKTEKTALVANGSKLMTGPRCIGQMVLAMSLGGPNIQFTGTPLCMLPQSTKETKLKIILIIQVLVKQLMEETLLMVETKLEVMTGLEVRIFIAAIQLPQLIQEMDQQ